MMRSMASILFAALCFLAMLVPSASAASLTYTSPSNISLASPVITLTIASGSSANALIVNATSVQLTLSPSEVFNLISPIRDLSVSAGSSGGISNDVCTAGSADMTLSQSTGQTTYTVSPTGQACVIQPTSVPPTSGGGGGGSVNVAASYGSPYVPGAGIIPSSSASSSPASSATASISSSTSVLQTELNALLAELATLQSEAGESPSTPASSAPFIFTRNLYFGITGNDVKELQTFLISQDTGHAAGKLAAHGTTTYFGSLTQNALIEFQKNAGIHPVIGYFGPITRRYVNNLQENSSTMNQS
jgi:hypothetical protein